MCIAPGLWGKVARFASLALDLWEIAVVTAARIVDTAQQLSVVNIDY